MRFGGPETKISGTAYSADGKRRKGRVYILEPDSTVRTFFARVANRLGYTAHNYDQMAAAEITAADVLVVEPFDRASLSAAVELQARLPGVRIICVSDSISLPPQAKALRPHAYIVKPFKLEELERALRRAFWR